MQERPAFVSGKVYADFIGIVKLARLLMKSGLSLF